MEKNVVATISHNEYKDVLLNNKYIRHFMNRIQCKDHEIGTYEINKISLFFFFFWWQNIYSKQWIWLISYWLSVFIIKKAIIFTSISKSYFVNYIVLISSLIRTVFLSSILNLKIAKHLKNIWRTNSNSVTS